MTGRTYHFRQVSREEWDTIAVPLKGIPFADKPWGDMIYDMMLFTKEYGCELLMSGFTRRPLTDCGATIDFGGKDLAASDRATGIIAPTFEEMYIKNKEAFA